jgi:hypothetical protein
MEEQHKISVSGKIYPSSPTDQSTIVSKRHYEMMTTTEFKLSFTEEGFVNIHYKQEGKLVREPLHRYIMAKLEKIVIPEGSLITHRNGIRYDNSFSNLSIVTKKYTSAFIKQKKETDSSNYKGVSYNTSRKKYISFIRYNGKRFNLGQFTEQKAAALMYDTAYIAIHGSAIGCNNLLTNQQIQQILEDPEKYKPRGKNESRDLPSNIQKNNSSTYTVQFRKEGINKNFKTLEEAITFRNEIIKNRK